MIAARKPNDDSVYLELAMLNPDACVARGFADAYLGHSAGLRPVAVYDYETCIEIVMVEKCCSYEQAMEYLEEHTVPDYVTPDMPVFVVTK